MKVIIFGSDGMLGKYVSLYLRNKYEIKEINRNVYDVLKDDDNKLIDIISDSHVVINCIGIIPQTSIIDENIYYKVNTVFPHLLSKYSNKLIHISTDCVFNGLEGNYDENSIHTETNLYGISKSKGEPLNATIIRTSIIGEELYHKKSFLEWIRSQNNNTINGFDNHLWNGVSCYQLSKIINKIIEKDIFWKGVRHIFSPKIYSKYELIQMIIDIYKLNINVNKINTPVKCDKTLTSIYNMNFDIPDIKDQIIEQKGFIEFKE